MRKKLFLLLLCLTAFSMLYMQAATRTVSNINDSGTSSFRQAVSDASDGDVINFNASLAGQKLTLASQIVIKKSLTINGNSVIFTGNDTIKCPIQIEGSGVTVTMNRIRFDDFKTKDIAVAGVYSGATLNVNSCIISNNYSSGNASGLYASASALNVRGSTFYNNKADGYGACIYSNNSNNVVTLTGCVIYGNTAAYKRIVYIPSGAGTSGGYNVWDDRGGYDLVYNGVGDVQYSARSFDAGTFCATDDILLCIPSEPAGFPATDFYGEARTYPKGVAGAVGKANIITFRWKGKASGTKSITIRATSGKSFTVDWGNGTTTTHTGTGGATNVTLTSPAYGDTNDYTVTISAGSSDCRFTYLNLNNTEVGSLDISGAPALTYLSCYSNQLTALDISSNTALAYLSCYSNRLSLSDLYAASQKISVLNQKHLGTQTWVPRDVLTGEEINLSAQTTFGATPTVFTVLKGGVAAALGTDYNLSGGKFTFLKADSYTVEMTNAAIISYSSYPAKVVANYAVTGSDKANDRVSFTWKGKASGAKTIFVRATEGKSFTVDWGNGYSTPKTGAGYDFITLTSPAYGNTE